MRDDEYQEFENMLNSGQASQVRDLLTAKLATQTGEIDYKTEMLLGVAEFRMGRFADAEARFRKVVELKKDHFIAFYYLGLCLERQDLKRKALEAFKEANRLRPDFTEARDKLQKYEVPVSTSTTSANTPIRTAGWSDFYVPRTDAELQEFISKREQKERAEYQIEIWKKLPRWQKIIVVFVWVFILFCFLALGVAGILLSLL